MAELSHHPAAAAKLHERLSTDLLGTAEQSDLFDELRDQIRVLHAHPSRNKSKSAADSETDSLGTRLWNLCTRLKREADTKSDSTSLKKLLLLGRVFAFHLLNIAHCAEKGEVADIVRLLGLALTAARSCIGRRQ